MKEKKSILKTAKLLVTALFLILLVYMILSISVSSTQMISESKKILYNDHVKHGTEIMKSDLDFYIDFLEEGETLGIPSVKTMSLINAARLKKDNGLYTNYLYIISYKGELLYSELDRIPDGVVNRDIYNRQLESMLKNISQGNLTRGNLSDSFTDTFFRGVRQAGWISFIEGLPDQQIAAGIILPLNRMEKSLMLLKGDFLKKKYLITAGVICGLLILFFLFFIYIGWIVKRIGKDIHIIIDNLGSPDGNKIEAIREKIRFKESASILLHAEKLKNTVSNTEKELLHSEKMLKLQKEQSPLAYIVYDPYNIITDWNSAAEEIFGYPKEEAVGRGLDLILTEDIIPEIADHLNEVRSGNSSSPNVNLNKTKSGELITCEWYDYTLKDMNGRLLGSAAIAQDITDRIRINREIRQKNAELEKALEEKRVLLKEVHHRVKNNMAVISSFLSLQAFSIDDSNLQKLIQSSQNRINSMSLVHEQLYRSESIESINIGKYISELVESLMMNFGYTEEIVAVHLETPEMHLSLNTLVPLGMLINEIVSNAFKYALSGEDKLQLRIRLAELDMERMLFEIGDNGPGFDAAEVSSKSGSIGMMLIHSLAEQLKGQLEYNSDNGTFYRIIIPKSSLKKTS